MKTLDEIESLIKKHGPLEDLKIKFVTSLSEKKARDIAKSFVAFANSGGGYLVIGMNILHKKYKVDGIDNGKYIADNFLPKIVDRYVLGKIYFETKIIDVECEPIVVVLINGRDTYCYLKSEKSLERIYAYKGEGVAKEQLITEKTYSYVFKYMTVESFILSLYSRTLRFVEPSAWNDKYEQRFYCAKYCIPNSVTPQVFATCFTRKQNNEAAWKVYSHGQGLNSHCLQMKLDVVELREQIFNHYNDFAEMTVEYKDENFINNLHKKKHRCTSQYFSPFNLHNYLKLLCLKRDAYSYEKEVRYIIIPDLEAKSRNSSKKAEYRDIPIAWEKVIMDVRIDKDCSLAELKAIQQACFSVGIEPVFDRGKNIPCNGLCCPADHKKVNFVSFNIDDMPGTSVITIK